MAAPVLTLNSSGLRKRVARLGLRPWWLAEQVAARRDQPLAPDALGREPGVP